MGAYMSKTQYGRQAGQYCISTNRKLLVVNWSIFGARRRNQMRKISLEIALRCMWAQKNTSLKNFRNPQNYDHIKVLGEMFGPPPEQLRFGEPPPDGAPNSAMSPRRKTSAHRRGIRPGRHYFVSFLATHSSDCVSRVQPPRNVSRNYTTRGIQEGRGAERH